MVKGHQPQARQKAKKTGVKVLWFTKEQVTFNSVHRKWVPLRPSVAILPCPFQVEGSAGI